MFRYRNLLHCLLQVAHGLLALADGGGDGGRSHVVERRSNVVRVTQCGDIPGDHRWNFLLAPFGTIENDERRQRVRSESMTP